MYETSSSYDGSNSWYGDRSDMLYGSGSWFTRGGSSNLTTSAGIFNFASSSGSEIGTIITFRPVIFVK